MVKFAGILPKMVRLGKLTACIGVSFLAHIAALHAFGMFGRFDFRPPVNPLSVISVDLKDAPRQREAPNATSGNYAETSDHDAGGSPDAEQHPAQAGAEEPIPEPAPAVMPPPDKEPARTENLDALVKSTTTETWPRYKPARFELLQPLRTPGEFMGFESETLSYRIYLLGIPVGNARLEARRHKGEVQITLKVISDPVLATIYPVDNLVETRHINGNFIISRIRQKEGSFTGDRGFTIFLRDKSVFWIDRLAKSSVREEIPNSEVVDILSGLYYLRNRQLQVGKPETVHIYDSSAYAAVPVDVLERETIRLPDFTEVTSLIIQPKLKTGGIFRRTGDIRIWLSDDEYRVPVKIVTSIALGRVTAELISAESK